MKSLEVSRNLRDMACFNETRIDRGAARFIEPLREEMVREDVMKRCYKVKPEISLRGYSIIKPGPLIPGRLIMSGSPFCSCSIIFGGQPAYPHFGPQPYKEMYSLMELPPPIRLSPSIVTTLLLRHVEDLVCDSLTPIAFAHGISDIRPSKSPQKYKCINQKKRKGDKGTSLTQ